MEFKIPKFECLICLGEYYITDSLTLSCDHRFCKDCLLQDWILNINKGYVQPTILKCPSEKCETPITIYELRYNLPKDIYEKYLKFSNENYQTNPNSKEVLIKCPNKKCNTPYFIFRGASYFTCSKCKIKYCADCMGEYPKHEGIPCEEYQEKNQSPEEYELKKLMQNSGAMRCPHCKNYGIKPDGCNFIYCTSAACQKRKMFCYLCGIPLTEADHFTHFNNQPYGNSCKTTVEKLQKGDVKGINKIVKVKKDNENPCPSCGTKDPDLCEFLENFEKSICFCKSEKCNNKILCVKCKKELQEIEVYAHYMKGE